MPYEKTENSRLSINPICAFEYGHQFVFWHNQLISLISSVVCVFLTAGPRNLLAYFRMSIARLPYDYAKMKCLIKTSHAWWFSRVKSRLSAQPPLGWFRHGFFRYGRDSKIIGSILAFFVLRNCKCSTYIKHGYAISCYCDNLHWERK